MKNIFYSLLLISNIGFCQDDTTNVILKFVYEHHHKKVGQGVCSELVLEAMKLKYNNFGELFRNRDTLNSKWVAYLEDIKAGDIILFREARFSDGDYIDNHMGIVTDIQGDSILYASQNVQMKRHEREKIIDFYGKKVSVYKKSRVVYSAIYMNKLISGYVEIYRF